MGRNKKEEEKDNEDEAEEVLEEGDEAPWSAVPARWGRAAPAVPTTTNYTTDGSRAHPGRWSRHRGLLRPGGARGVETAPRYLYSAPSADPALRLEGRGVATGTGGNREGRGVSWGGILGVSWGGILGVFWGDILGVSWGGILGASWGSILWYRGGILELYLLVPWGYHGVVSCNIMGWYPAVSQLHRGMVPCGILTYLSRRPMRIAETRAVFTGVVSCGILGVSWGGILWYPGVSGVSAGPCAGHLR